MVLNSGIGQRGGGTMPVPRVGTFLTRGKAARQATMLTAITPDALVPQGHPIRRIKPMVDRALAQLSSTFDGMYADLGRASMPPEHLQLACLPMALYSYAGNGGSVSVWSMPRSSVCCRKNTSAWTARCFAHWDS